MDADLVTPGPPWLPVEVHDSVGSTNAELARDPRVWRVVTAEEQRAGRGRHDRAWTTTPGTSIAASILVPRPASAPPGWVPLVVGLALRDALSGESGLDVHEAGVGLPGDVSSPTGTATVDVAVCLLEEPAGVPLIPLSRTGRGRPPPRCAGRSRRSGRRRRRGCSP